jgi:hypothetical protein
VPDVRHKRLVLALLWPTRSPIRANGEGMILNNAVVDRPAFGPAFGARLYVRKASVNAARQWLS